MDLVGKRADSGPSVILTYGLLVKVTGFQSFSLMFVIGLANKICGLFSVDSSVQCEVNVLVRLVQKNHFVSVSTHGLKVKVT